MAKTTRLVWSSPRAKTTCWLWILHMNPFYYYIVSKIISYITFLLNIIFFNILSNNAILGCFSKKKEEEEEEEAILGLSLPIFVLST